MNDKCTLEEMREHLKRVFPFIEFVPISLVNQAEWENELLERLKERGIMGRTYDQIIIDEVQIKESKNEH